MDGLSSGRRPGIHDPGRPNACAQRQTTAQTFSKTEEVWNHPLVKEGEKGSGPAEAREDLVEDQKGLRIPGQIRQGLQVARGRNPNPGPALNRLDDHSPHLIPAVPLPEKPPDLVQASLDRPIPITGVREGREADALIEAREERAPEIFPVRGGQGSRGQAVVGPLKG